QLIEDLEAKGKWSDEIADTIKANNGSVQSINELDGVIDKELFKTAYEIHPRRQIDIAAAFQESIDQAVSKSLYIDEHLRNNMEEIYLYAWEKKLKSTYYCFIDKVVKGEKYTENVNKRGARKGFGGGSTVSAVNGDSSDKPDRIKPGNKVGPAPTSSANGDSSENSDTAGTETPVELEAKARKTFGDEVVDQALKADADSCPTDPMLRKICPACE